ncbi:MaoC family dehydratase [Cereibacter azotoformans]|uniref:MaoC family dehydratase n=1 Tax=Cereibacter azotoformans TaxID=43057 RepID=UPI000C6CF480|nr:MaoC/PaaZ C-terminal domain-containing protein [Cereibacter azotoformans]
MSVTGQFEPVVLGCWFEDFSEDLERRSPGRTITEADLMAFSGLTGDYSQVHTDEEFCRNTEFGTRIGHGLLGLSIAQGLMWRTNYTQGTGVASLGWTNWSFRRPIFIGDTVRVRWRLTSKRESGSKPGMGIIHEWCRLMNQKDEILQEGEHITLIRRRPA